MIEINKQWSTWITWIAGAIGACMAFIPELGLPDPWPAILMMISAMCIYLAKHTKQKPKDGNDV